jgi:hypothetical protein
MDGASRLVKTEKERRGFREGESRGERQDDRLSSERDQGYRGREQRERGDREDYREREDGRKRGEERRRSTRDTGSRSPSRRRHRSRSRDHRPPDETAGRLAGEKEAPRHRQSRERGEEEACRRTRHSDSRQESRAPGGSDGSEKCRTSRQEPRRSRSPDRTTSRQATNQDANDYFKEVPGYPSKRDLKVTSSKSDLGRHEARDRHDKYYDERRRHESREHPRQHHEKGYDDGEVTILPIDEWPRKLKHWDVAPLGFDGMTAEQVKATGKLVFLCPIFFYFLALIYSCSYCLS